MTVCNVCLLHVVEANRICVSLKRFVNMFFLLFEDLKISWRLVQTHSKVVKQLWQSLRPSTSPWPR